MLGNLAPQGRDALNLEFEVSRWLRRRAIIELLSLALWQLTFLLRRSLFVAWTKPSLVLAVLRSGPNQLSLMTGVVSLY